MTRTSRAAALGLAAFALSAAPALAADGTVGVDKLEYTYKTAQHSGFVYTSDVASNVPACSSAIFECEKRLVEVTDAGKVVFKITGTSAAPTPDVPYDVDLHIYKSDAKGTQGALVGEGVTAEANETVTVAKATPGFYLVLQDWYFGAGTVAGSVKFTPPVVAPAPAR